MGHFTSPWRFSGFRNWRFARLHPFTSFTPLLTPLPPGDHQFVLCTYELSAALFTTQPKFPSVDGWIRKRQYVYTTDCYSAIKNDILPFSMTQTDLESVC